VKANEKQEGILWRITDKDDEERAAQGQKNRVEVNGDKGFLCEMRETQWKKKVLKRTVRKMRGLRVRETLKVSMAVFNYHLTTPSVTVKWAMNWKVSGRKRSWPCFKYYSCIFLDALRKP
jgi:hypothetical protein